MIHLIDAVLDPLLWFLADWSLRWVVVIGVFAAWLFLLRPRRAATRSLVGWMILMAGLLLPALPRWGTGWSIAGPATATPLFERVTERLPSSLPDLLEVRAPVADAERAEKTPALETAVSLPPPAESAEPPSLPSTEPLGAKRIWILSLTTFWFAGMGTLFLRRLGGWILLERIRRGAVVLQGAPAALFAACQTQFRWRRQAKLAVHAAVRSPIMLGLFRPTIVVPPSWVEEPEAVQRGSLLHELAHLVRYDDWSALLLELVRVVFFFHPPLRWLLARLEREREFLCDETAIAHSIDPRDYARMLMDLARQPGRLLPAPFIGPSYPIHIGNHRTVKARINRLLEANMYRWMSPLPAWRAVLLVFVSLLLALGMGSFRISAAPQSSTTGPIPATAAKPLSSEPESEVLAMPRPWQEDEAKSEKTPYRIRPFHVLRIKGGNVPIDADYVVEPDGKVNIGLTFGHGLLYERIELGGLTLEEAGRKIDSRQKALGVKIPNISVSLGQRSYGSKSFHDWCTVLATDLKPEVRIEAIKALREFGVNGHGNDAAEAIIASIRGYDTERFDADDAKVIDAAEKALVKIRSESVPELLKELKKGKVSGRRFAAKTLYNLGTPAIQWNESVMPALIEAIHDEDKNVRGWAFRALVTRVDGKKLLEKDRKLLVTASELLASSEYPPLGEPSHPAFQFLASLGPDAKEAVPALVALLKDPKNHNRNDLWNGIPPILAGLGPETKEAVPALVALLKDPQVKGWSHQGQIVQILGAIGPDAKEAVLVLTELLQQAAAAPARSGVGSTRPGDLNQRLLKDALDKIDK